MSPDKTKLGDSQKFNVIFPRKDLLAWLDKMTVQPQLYAKNSTQHSAQIAED